MNDINSGAREKTNRLTKKEIIARAYAMPFASPAYTAAPDKFFDRPALTVSYRTDLDRVRALVPALRWIRLMPTSIAIAR
jgi:acetoacetate decarboxylase